MQTYSVDLRRRVIAAVARGGESQPQIARRLEVSLPYVEKVVKRPRETGLVTAPPHVGGTPRNFDAAADARPTVAVHKTPDATLAQLRAAVDITCGRRWILPAGGGGHHLRHLDHLGSMPTAETDAKKSSPTPL